MWFQERIARKLSMSLVYFGGILAVGTKEFVKELKNMPEAKLLVVTKQQNTMLGTSTALFNYCVPSKKIYIIFEDSDTKKETNFRENFMANFSVLLLLYPKIFPSVVWFDIFTRGLCKISRDN